MKKSMLTAVVAVLALAALFFVWMIGVNNDLVRLDEARKAAWSQVDAQLQRRYDLIPNLVETVKGYASHEKELFESVSKARSQWASAKTTEEKVAAAGILERGLGRLIAVSEAYPDLKASENFKNLQFELAGTENRIAVARKRYIDSVQQYNTTVRQFPVNLTAMVFGYKEKPNFTVENEAAIAKPPTVDFGTSQPKQ